MKTKTLFALVAAFTVSAFCGAPAHAADKAGAPADMSAVMEKVKAAGTPGAEHAVLKPLEGQWNVASRSWMKPGDKPMESSGTSSFEWILGGRFLKQDYKGTWMGQSFQGVGLVGYDNVKKEYNTIWMDNMATGIMKGTGQYDKGSKTIKDTGTYSCPIAGHEMPYRSEWKIASKDKQIYTMYTTGPDGKEMKMMELTYTRAK